MYRLLQYTDLVDEVVQQAVGQLFRVATLVEATHLQLMLQLSLQRSASWMHQHCQQPDSSSCPDRPPSQKLKRASGGVGHAKNVLGLTLASLESSWRSAGSVSAGCRSSSTFGFPVLCFRGLTAKQVWLCLCTTPIPW